MALEIQTAVFKLYMDIKDYEPDNRQNWYTQWCPVSFAVTSDFMNYHKDNDEILLSCEVDSLVEQIDNLLHKRKTENVSCIEPDLEFFFYPPGPNNDCAGGYMEVRIAFWSNDGLTADSLHICLDEKEAKIIRDYLLTVQNK